MCFRQPMARNKEFSGRSPGFPGQNASSGLAETPDRPAADHRAEGFDSGFVEREIDRRVRKLLAVAHEYAALADEPDGGDHKRALIRIGQKAMHQVDGRAHERRRFLADELAEDRRRTHRFPVEDAEVPTELVAPNQRLKLMANEFA